MGKRNISPVLSAPKIATAAESEISVRSTRLIRVFSGGDHMLSEFIAILGAVNKVNDNFYVLEIFIANIFSII